MKNKSILILTPRFPYPPIGGDKLRIFKECEVLSKKYDLGLVSFIDEDFDYDDYIDLKSIGVFKEIHLIKKSKFRSYVDTLFGFLKGQSLQVSYYSSKAMSAKVEELSIKYDVIFPHLIRMAQYVFPFVKRKITILEMTDAISMNYSRVKGFSFKKVLYKIERSRLLKYEIKCIESFNLTSLISNKDKDYFGVEDVCSDKFIVVSNGVSLQDIQRQDNKRRLDKKEIIFIGNINTEQNYDAVLWFSKYVMPRLIDKGFRFKIIGKISNSKKTVLDKYPGVEVTGTVKSMTEATSASWIGVCPMRIGAGVQNKVLEYMALGLPCITSSVGYEGLSANINEEILVADTPDEIISKISVLSDDSCLYNKISDGGHNYVKHNHDWDSVINPLAIKIKNILEQS